MANLIVLIGVSGAGKSTWAEKYQEEHPNCKIVSSDQMRFFVNGSESDQSNGRYIFEQCYKAINFWLKHDYDVVFDATNLTKRARSEIFKNTRQLSKPPTYIAYYFDIPLEVCLEHQKLRKRQVPKNVVTTQFKKIQPPAADEGWYDIHTIWNRPV